MRRSVSGRYGVWECEREEDGEEKERRHWEREAIQKGEKSAARNRVDEMAKDKEFNHLPVVER
jgi:hypothetical protein